MDSQPEETKNTYVLGSDVEELARLDRQAAWLEPYCRQHGLRYCPRKQIEWYGLARGT